MLASQRYVVLFVEFVIRITYKLVAVKYTLFWPNVMLEVLDDICDVDLTDIIVIGRY